MMQRVGTSDRIEESSFQDMCQLVMQLEYLFHLMVSSYAVEMQMVNSGSGTGRPQRTIVPSRLIMEFV